jgi:hypothetical protein
MGYRKEASGVHLAGRGSAARVLARLEEPNRLIIETCNATAWRISEVLGT